MESIHDRQVLINRLLIRTYMFNAGFAAHNCYSPWDKLRQCLDTYANF